MKVETFRKTMIITAWLLCMALFAACSECAISAETNSGPNLAPVLSARSAFDALMAKTKLITNAMATLKITSGRNQVWRDRQVYYRSIPTGITRIDHLGTQQTAGGSNSEVAVYSLLIDEVARVVYAKSRNQYVILDGSSNPFWLSLVDLFSGKPSRLINRDIELTDIYHVGGDVVGNSQAEVFLLQTRPAEDQRLWVDTDRGLVTKAKAQNLTFELGSLNIGPELPEDEFALNLDDKEIQEISERQIGQWWPRLLVPQSTQTVERVVSGPATVFTFAAAGDTNAVREFILTSAEAVNATNDYGATPLHYAAMEGRVDTVTLLVNSGASIDPKNAAGTTPLWLASAYGRTAVVKYLISKGANISTEAKITHLTPLHIAALNGQKGVVDLLLAKGADANAKSAAGETPLRLAIRRDHKDIADLLRQHGAK